MSDDFALIRARQKAIFGTDSPLVDNAGSTLAARLCNAYREAQGLPPVPFDMLPEHSKEVWQRVASVAPQKSTVVHEFVGGSPQYAFTPEADAVLCDLGAWFNKHWPHHGGIAQWVANHSNSAAKDPVLGLRIESMFPKQLGSKSRGLKP